MKQGSVRVVAILAAFWIFGLGGAAAQDAYHAALVQELEAEYGLTGGVWVFADTEAETAGLAGGFGNLSITQESVTGRPFTEVLRIEAPVRGPDPWSQKVEFYTNVQLVGGSSLLLIAWIRNVTAERGTGRAAFQFEETDPPYGKSLDDAVVPDTAWQRVMMPFRVGRNFPVGDGRFQITLGTQAQTIELAGVALRYYGLKYGVDALPRTRHSLDYPGRALDAPWRASAEARIAEHRKAALAVRVVDAAGQPVEGAEVHVRQRRHAFGFGTAVSVNRFVQSGADAARYRETLDDLTGDGRTFSIVVFENALKWDQWEREEWTATKAQTVSTIRWFRDRGIPVRGHNLIWPAWRFLPDDLEQNQGNPVYLRDRIRGRFEEILTYPGVQGEILEWDVVNEPIHERELAAVLGGESAYAEWFALADEFAPDTRLFVNEYSILSQTGLDLAAQEAYAEHIQGLLDAGVRLDGIGMQGHVGTPLAGPETVLEILDEFAAFGTDISITEYDAISVPDTLAADYMRDFLTAVFSHPSVSSFLMWGFWDNNHWFDDAPLFEEDWTLKPSGRVFLDLVFDTWWTDAAGLTDADGRFTAPDDAFLGAYTIDVAHDGQTAAYDVALTADTVLTVEAPTAVGNEAVDRGHGFILEGVFPHPVGRDAEVRFRVDRRQAVRVTLYDLLGRAVRTLYAGPVAADAAHTIRLDRAGLAPGVYVLDLTGETSRTVQLLTVVD